MIQNPPGTSGGVLLNAPAPKLDGGREHLARLVTTDGQAHYIAFVFNIEAEDGAVDLRAVETAKRQAREQGLANLVQSVTRAQMAPLAGAMGTKVNVSPVLEAEGGVLVVLTHVVSIEYLGRLKFRNPLRQVLVTELENGREGTYLYGDLQIPAAVD
jgi:hypothetical protein